LAQQRPNDLSISEHHIQRLFHHLHGAVEGIEVYDVIDRLQLDIVTHVFFGESTDSLDSEKQPFRDAMDTLLRVNTVRVALGYATIPSVVKNNAMNYPMISNLWKSDCSPNLVRVPSKN